MKNEAMKNLVFIGVPLDTVIVSGITSDSTVQVTVTNGIIVIERCDDDCGDFNNECNYCDCLCNDCRAALTESEDE